MCKSINNLIEHVSLSLSFSKSITPLEGLFLVNPLSYDFLHWLWSPLWSHMPDALDGHEVKTLILVVEAGDLPFSMPFSPVTNSGPLETFNPGFGSVGRKDTIGIARVVHHSDVAAGFEYFVNPLGSLHLEEPIAVHRFIAVLPSFVFNVKCCFRVFLVQPCG